jgi:hypothetical protein
MAKRFLFGLLAAILSAGYLAAQNADAPDTYSKAPQFFAFDLGTGIGYALDENLTDQLKGVTVLGFKAAIIDSIELGVDSLSSINEQLSSPPRAFAGMRIAYRVTPTFGMAIGIGQVGVLKDGDASDGVSMGLFCDIFAGRSSSDVAAALKIRVDYIAETSKIAKGALFFLLVFTIGL